jgi:hypothetical protein
VGLDLIRVLRLDLGPAEVVGPAPAEEEVVVVEAGAVTGLGVGGANFVLRVRDQALRLPDVVDAVVDRAVLLLGFVLVRERGVDAAGEGGQGECDHGAGTVVRGGVLDTDDLGWTS